MLRRLYDQVMSWGHSPRGTLALFLVAFVESSFFPIPPDVLLLALGLARHRRALVFALVASLGSVCGGLFGYLLGYSFWESLGPWFYSYVPGVTEQRFVSVQQLFQTYGFWVVFTAGFTPIPYKIFTIGAGVFRIDLVMFTLASLVSRSLRFFLIGGALFACGPAMKQVIERYFNLVTLVVTGLILLALILTRLLS